MSIYVQLTRRFNEGRVRAILAGGQAVVLHRLAMMSKDGDWILREEAESVEHVLRVLDGQSAHYRFGAPLDARWMAGGWSAHLEFSCEGLRVRTDFVTRPPRLKPDRLAQIWREQESGRELPFLGARDLVETKKTNREKDYVVIGELARELPGVDERFLCSRSARDLMELAEKHPDRVAALAKERPLLAKVKEGIEALERELDAERRHLIHANEQRLMRYMDAAQAWAARWPDVSARMAKLSLVEAHAVMVESALGALPFEVPGGLS